MNCSTNSSQVGMNWLGNSSQVAIDCLSKFLQVATACFCKSLQIAAILFSIQQPIAVQCFCNIAAICKCILKQLHLVFDLLLLFYFLCSPFFFRVSGGREGFTLHKNVPFQERLHPPPPPPPPPPPYYSYIYTSSSS